MITEAISYSPLADGESPTTWQCSLSEYHADRTAVSHSQIETFLADPALFHARYVSGLFPAPSRAALELGTVVHDALMREGGLEKAFVEIPPAVLSQSGARAGKRWSDFRAEHEGQVLLKEEEHTIVTAMIHNILDHPKAHALLEDAGDYEGGIRWGDEASGLLLRCRPDKVTESLIVDLKTSRSVQPRAFVNFANTFGYHRQAAWYQEGVAAMDSHGEMSSFVFVVVGNQPPYSCEVFELDEEFVALGRRQNNAALARLRRCIDADNWHSETHGEIVTLTPPPWVFRDSEWELGA